MDNYDNYYIKILKIRLKTLIILNIFIIFKVKALNKQL